MARPLDSAEAKKVRKFVRNVYRLDVTTFHLCLRLGMPPDLLAPGASLSNLHALSQSKLTQTSKWPSEEFYAMCDSSYKTIMGSAGMVADKIYVTHKLLVYIEVSACIWLKVL